MKVFNHNKENLIVSTAGCLFADKGIKSVCMDDIASSCKISKKTIYKHFETKELLLMEIVSKTFLENTIEFETLNYAENIFESMEQIFKAVEKIYTVITPVFIAETKINFVSIYSLITHLELIHLKNNLTKIIDSGRSQDIFNNIAEIDFLIKVYFNFLHNLIRDTNESLHILNQIRLTNNYFLYSLLSPKGLHIQTKY